MIDKYVVVKRKRSDRNVFKPVAVYLTQGKAILAAQELPADSEYGLAEVLKTEVIYSRPIKEPVKHSKAHRKSPKHK